MLWFPLPSPFRRALWNTAPAAVLACLFAAASPSAYAAINNSSESTSAATLILQSGSTNLGSANVCPGTQTVPAPCSHSATLTFKASASTTFSATTPLGVFTLGASSRDFTSTASTCKGTLAADTTCTITVKFAPEFSGPRYGAIVFYGTAGEVIAATDLFGTGLGPQVVFNPGTKIYLGGNWDLGSPTGLAVDGSGNVYVAANYISSVEMIPHGCTAAKFAGGSCAATMLGGGLNDPYAVAVDGAGNIFVADENDTVVKEIPAGCTLAAYDKSSCKVASLGGGFSVPDGIALDGNGNIFVADSFNNAVKMIPPGCGSATCVVAMGGGLSSPAGLAVDGSGNIYVADLNNQAVKEIPARCTATEYKQGTCAVTALGGGWNGPATLAVDASGNLYVADFLDNLLKEVPAGCTALLYQKGACEVITLRTIGSPVGPALDGAANLYLFEAVFTTSGTGTFLEQIDRAAGPALNFGTVAATSEDTPPLREAVANAGNAQLVFPPPSSGTNPSVDGHFVWDKSSTCKQLAAGSASATLAAGASCIVAVDFDPVALGPVTGSLVIADNARNAAAPNYAQQTIALSGAGTAAPSRFAVSMPSWGYVSEPLKATVTAYDAHGNVVKGYQGTVHFSSTDPNAMLPSNYAFTAADQGTHQFDLISFAATGAQTVTVNDKNTPSIKGTSGPVSVTIPQVVVNTTADDATGNANNCVTAGAKCTLRDAIAVQVYTSSLNIAFDPKVFASPSIIKLSSPLQITNSTIIDGPTAGSGPTLTNLLTINAGGATAFKTLETVGEATFPPEIRHLTITRGAVGIFTESALTVSDSTFSNLSGPAIVFNTLYPVTVTGCTFSNNKNPAGNGAAITNDGYPSSSLTVNNSTFYGNSAKNGGAIYLDKGLITVTNSTFSGNSVTGQGGAIFVGIASLTANNNIFAGNSSATGGGGIYNSTGTAAGSYNLFYHDLSGSSESDCFGCTDTHRLSGNSHLSLMRNNGGPTLTMVPLPGSAALCAASAAAANTAGLAADQRGVTFNAGGYCPAGTADAGSVQSDYRLAFTVNPKPISPATSIQAGKNFQAAVTLIENGSAFKAASVEIPLTLTSNPAGATLTNGAQATVGGVAAFTTLQVNKQGTGDKLRASLTLNGKITLAAASGLFNVAP